MHLVLNRVVRATVRNERRSFSINKETAKHTLRRYRKNQQSQRGRYVEKYRVFTYQLSGNYFTEALSEQRQRTQAKLIGGYINVLHTTC